MTTTDQPSSLRMFAYDMKVWNDWVWVQSAAWTAIPGLLISFYKMWQYYRKTDLVRNKINNGCDWVIRVTFSYCFIYYFLDSVIIILLGQYDQPCYQAYFLHHITAQGLMKNVLSWDKPVFWFEAFSIAMHNVTLALPSNEMSQYIYSGSMYFSSAMHYVRPYSNYEPTRRIYKYHIPILLSIFLLYYLGCVDTEEVIMETIITDIPAEVTYGSLN